MKRGKRFVEKYRHGFPKKSQGRYSTKIHLCTVILLMAMVLGIYTTPDLLLGQWQNTEASAADVWDGSTSTNWTGSGTKTKPYIITTAAQLAGLAQSVRGGTTYSGEYFKLANDIDLNGREWTPIGFPSYSFWGNFDGNGHTISNLYINSGSYRYAGLFGYIRNSATISNLKVSGSVNNTYSSHTSSTGGIVGHAFTSTIEYCASSVNVSAENASYVSIYVGGVMGYLYLSSKVQYCYNTGSVTATRTAGASAYFSSAGGVAGCKGGNGTSNIIGCYNTGTVKVIGGINGIAYAGGLCGINGSTLNVKYSYNVGAVSAEGTEIKIGGLAAGNRQSTDTINITNSYWLDTCGASSDHGSSSTATRKKTAEELKGDEVLALLNAGNPSNPVWQKDIGVNNGYPILLNNHEEPLMSDEVTLGSGESVNDALGKLNPGGTIHVDSTITVSTTETWDGTALIDGSGKKVTIDGGSQTGLTMVKVTGTGNLTVKNLDFVGSGIIFDCDQDGQVTLENVKITGSGLALDNMNGKITLKDVETTGAMNGEGTLYISGKVVVPSTNLDVAVIGDLTTGSSIGLKPTENGQEIVRVSSPKTSLTATEKGYFTILDSDYRLVTKQPSGTTSFTALYAYLKPKWSVNINTDTSGEIRLTPTLTNFIDGDYGDKLKVKILYPTDDTSFTLIQGDDSIECRFSLNNSSWFTDNNQSIDFTSSATSAKTLYYTYDSDEPKYSGSYTGKVRFEGTLTEAT